MHHIIRMIVYAKTKKQARSRAEEIFNERLTPSPFDYGTFFDEDSPMSGKSRWGDIPPVELADSKEGKKLIDKGFEIIKEEFMENLEHIKKMIKNYDDNELFEGKILNKNHQMLEELEETKQDGMGVLDKPYWFSYTCGKIEKGNWLFGNDGEAIQNSKNLENVLTKKYCEDEDKDAKVWVLPIDVHT